MTVYKYTDIWGGRNYGCYPKSTLGQKLKEKLDQSALWDLVAKQDYIDERNDNQIDIHRGSDFSYTHNNSQKRIDVHMHRSRSGKTVEWTFRCNFDEPINF